MQHYNWYITINIIFNLCIVFPTDFKFVTQICSTFEDDEIQPNWFPELPVTCVENGLAISETLFRIVSD